MAATGSNPLPGRIGGQESRDGEALRAHAHVDGARVVLIGDVKQLGSVAAGRASGELQDADMETPTIAEIVRRSNPDTRRAVEALLAGNAEAAFAALDDGGGEVLGVGLAA